MSDSHDPGDDRDAGGNNALGTFQRHGEHLDVRFERHYPRPPETVWAALTQPERLADWMGQSRVEPRVGGRIEMMIGHARPMHGTILQWEPPRVLAFTWSNEDSPDAVVRYELSADGGGTRLVFTHQRMPHESCALMLPGWHFLLNALGGALAGMPLVKEAPTWLALQGRYVQHYQLTGVRLDPKLPPGAQCAAGPQRGA